MKRYQLNIVRGLAAAVFLFELSRTVFADVGLFSDPPVTSPGVIVPITRQMRAQNGASFGLLYDLGLVADNNSSASYEAASLIDTDGDGQTDWQEHVAGTAPDNSNDVFRVTIQDGDTLSWNTASGRTYSVVASGNLESDMQPLTNGLSAGTWPIPKTNSSSFFRVEVNLP